MESMEQSAPASSLKKFSPLVAESLGDQLLVFVRRLMKPSGFEAVEKFMEKIGHYALLAALLIGLVYGIVDGIKSNTLSAVGMGLGWVLILVLLQYTAIKFNRSNRQLIKASPTDIGTASFLECMALIFFIGGLLILIVCTVTAIRMESWGWFGWAMGGFILAELLVWMCLNPSLLDISITPAATVGLEAMGVLSFLLKVFLRLVPMAYGAGAILGGCGVFWALIELFRNNGGSGGLMMAPGTWTVLSSAALPWMAYLAFLIAMLGLEVTKAILGIPSRLDALRR